MSSLLDDKVRGFQFLPHPDCERLGNLGRLVKLEWLCRYRVAGLITQRRRH